jgi:uncharacterized protein
VGDESAGTALNGAQESTATDADKGLSAIAGIVSGILSVIVSSSKPALIIDTNVVLDAWFFQAPPTVALVTALLRTHEWVCTEWMQREAQRVATLASLRKYATAQALLALEQAFISHAVVVAHTTASPMRCRDPDDQAFLDLATHTQAQLLLTLDRDLLKLKKRAAMFGLNITQPSKIVI